MLFDGVAEELEENRAVIRDIIQALMRPLVGVRWSHRAVDDGMDETLIPKAPGVRVNRRKNDEVCQLNPFFSRNVAAML